LGSEVKAMARSSDEPGYVAAICVGGLLLLLRGLEKFEKMRRQMFPPSTSHTNVSFFSR